MKVNDKRTVMAMSKVLGIGADIVKLARFKRIVLRNGLKSMQTETFAMKILHPEQELPLFKECVAKDQLDRTIRLLAGSWAMKEAVFKCLDDKVQQSQKFKHWYKYNADNGRPMVGGLYVQNNPKEEFLLSISHDDDTLIASVLRQLNN